MQYCIFNQNKICDNCSDCNICDIEKNKICNSCGKCLEIFSDYKEVRIDGILFDESELDDYIFDDEVLEVEQNDKEENVVYIEDIPELREKYYKELEEFFKEREE